MEHVTDKCLSFVLSIPPDQLKKSLTRVNKRFPNGPCKSGRIILIDNRLIWIESMCFKQASFNMDHYYRDIGKNLFRVVGSLGIGQPSDKNGIWFEFGAAQNTIVKDYRDTYSKKDNSWDAHVWLEDSEGKVYDIVTEQMVYAALFHDKTMHLPEGTVIEDTKDKLMDKGLRYIAAPGVTQGMLHAVMAKRMLPEFESNSLKHVLQAPLLH